MNEPNDPIDLVEQYYAPIDMEVRQKIPIWEQQILQNAKGHETLHEANGSIEK